MKDMAILGPWELTTTQQVRKGVIHHVHPAITKEELMEEATASSHDNAVKILNAKRVQNKMGGFLSETVSVVITFESEGLPEVVMIFNERYRVIQYFPDPT